MNFTNKRVVITGAAVGTERDIAIAFSNVGAHVAINYSKSSNDAEKTIELVKSNGVNGISVSSANPFIETEIAISRRSWASIPRLFSRESA